MAGTQTAEYDLVIQFSEEAYADLLGVVFDSGGLISRIADLIPGVSTDLFTLTLSIDRPTDISLPPDAENPLDIFLGLGEDGGLATVRMVVGILVDRSNPERDTVLIDFENSIYHASVSVGSTSLPIPGLTGALADIIPSVPVLPVPVDRTSDAPATITRVDFKIIDDTSGADRDATSGMLTFGGGSAGNLANLNSFVPDDGRGAIGVFFSWLCRLAVPTIESALGLPGGSFDITNERCALNRVVRVDEDQEVDLTALNLTLVDGAIQVDARVAKSGFCYEASGDISASLLLEIEDGRLIASAEVGDPNVDIEIPLICWIAGAAIGAALGGVLGGVIGSIVTTILVPLMMWLATDVLEGTIDDAMDRVAEAINDAIPDVNVPAFGVNILFQDVFIDDVVLQAELEVVDNSPIRAEGVARLERGEGLDLDTGRVNDADIAQVDVIWRGRGDRRRLETGCQAALAATGSRAFGGLPRYRLYAYPYRQPATVALFELGVPNPLGSLFGDEFIESRQVFAVRTNQGRYALVQATEVEDDSVLLGFKTYETTQAAVQIVGGFQCERAARIPRDAAITFRPQGTKSDGTPERETAGRPTVVTTRPGTLPPRATASDVAAASRLRAGVERPTTPLRGTRVLYVEKFHTGNWVAEYALPQKAYARLSAVATGVQGEVQYLWKVGGQPLKDGTSDRLTVSGQQVSYTVSGSELLLRVDSRAEIELYVEVSLVDDKGCATSAAFCAKHGGKCTHGQRYIPTWTEFRALHALSDAIARKGPLPLRTIQQGS